MKSAEIWQREYKQLISSGQSQDSAMRQIADSYETNRISVYHAIFPEPNLAKLSTTLRYLREDQNLSVADLSDIVGISSQQIYRIERGESEPGAFSLLRLIRSLGGVDYILNCVRTQKELVDELWNEHDLEERLKGSQNAGTKARRHILEAMGLWKD